MTLTAYKKLLADAERINDRVEAARKALAKNCTHPEEFLRPYPWETDNGYGRQNKRLGKACGICWKVDLWMMGHFVRTEDLDL